MQRIALLGASPTAVERRLPGPAVLAVGSAIALTATLPPALASILALAFIVVLGVPHGALDGELVRGVLEPRCGRAWFPIFAMPYLLLTGGVLLSWRVAPLGTLAIFLAASAWHFGATGTRSERLLDRMARGGLPIALPVLLHPAATLPVLATIANVSLERAPSWLSVGSAAWSVLAAVWVVRRMLRAETTALAGPAALVVVFLVLPPLSAFALYFVCVHAPAHTIALIDDASRAPRVRDLRSAVLLALPITAATVLIGVLVWPLYAGPLPSRLLSLILQLLAALTLPHLLLETWFAARGRTRVSRSFVARSP